MPSPIAHTLAAYSLMVTLEPSLATERRRNSVALGFSFVFGSLADADFLVAHFTTHPALRHHYFSHSIPFALALTALLWIALKLLRRPSAGKWACLLGAAYSTHLLLDYLTEDGSFPYGIPLLWPALHTHFVAPLLVFHSIHRGQWHQIFGPNNLQAVLTELLVMAPIALLVFLVARRRCGLPGGSERGKIPAEAIKSK